VTEAMMTLREVAEYLHLSTMSVRRAIEKKGLPAYRVGGLWRFNRLEVEAWLDTLATGDERR
jgi:excisionase family DNA binding protein